MLPSASSSFSLIILALLLPLLPRLLLLFSSHSGSSLSPHSSSNNGDYEAHRKWIGTALSLPRSEWYFHDLEYWGADYPPFCLLVHELFGRVLAAVTSDEDQVDLKLRGYEGGVVVMRLLNIAMEYSTSFLVLFLFLRDSVQCSLLSSSSSSSSSFSTSSALICTSLILSCPLLPLVDHGHFQISNGLPLSLALLSVHLTTSPSSQSHWQMAAGCVAFTLSILMKQMSLYFAPVVFFHLLSWSLSPPDGKLSSRALRFLTLAIPVLLTAALTFLPFPPSQYLHILQRMFPFHRGLFESKVSSLWCFLDTYPLDIRKRASPEALQKLSLLATLAAIAPSCAKALALKSASRTQMAKLLHQCALGFYLFSFHVHEKTILFPLFPLLLDFAAEGQLGYVAMQAGISMCSCWFLFVLDGLEGELGAALLWWGGVVVAGLELAPEKKTKKTAKKETRKGTRKATKDSDENKKGRKSVGEWIHAQLSFSIPLLALVAMLSLIAASHILEPPASLPDLYPVLVSAVGFCAFFCAWMRATWDVFRMENGGERGKEKSIKAE